MVILSEKLNIINMANVQKNFFIFSSLLFGTLSRVCAKKWSYFHTGCETASGRIAYLSNLHLSHCTAECNAHDKCKVFGYSSSDKSCILFDETFVTTTSYSCSIKTVSFYTDGTTLPHSTLPHNTNQHSTLPHRTLPQSTLPHSTYPQSTLPQSTLPHSLLPNSTSSPLITVTSTLSCDNATGYTYVTSLNKCLRYHSSDRLFWDDAQNVCENEGGHLAYVKTKEVLDYIRSFTYTGNEKYWIGGKQTQVGSKKFKWLSGETIGDTNGGQLWLDKRPAIIDPTSNYCLETKYPQDKTLFGFYDRECESVRRFFCELDVL